MIAVVCESIKFLEKFYGLGISPDFGHKYLRGCVSPDFGFKKNLGIGRTRIFGHKNVGGVPRHRDTF